MSDCDTVSLMWRLATDQEWQPLPAGAPLPLPPRPVELVLRAVLTSRHAALSPDATVVADRAVDVHHPEPGLVVEALPTPVRFEDARVAWRVQWVRSASLRVNGHAVPVDLRDPWTWSSIEHVVPTWHCGVVRFDLSMTGLDGQVHCQVHQIEVRPRDVHVDVRPIDTGRVELEVRGAKALTLAVPSLQQQHPLPSPKVLIAHGLLLPTLAIVSYEDDLGDIGAKSFALGNEPFTWSPVPQFQALSWRWS